MSASSSTNSSANSSFSNLSSASTATPPTSEYPSPATTSSGSTNSSPVPIMNTARFIHARNSTGSAITAGSATLRPMPVTPRRASLIVRPVSMSYTSSLPASANNLSPRARASIASPGFNNDLLEELLDDTTEGSLSEDDLEEDDGSNTERHTTRRLTKHQLRQLFDDKRYQLDLYERYSQNYALSDEYKFFAPPPKKDTSIDDSVIVKVERNPFRPLPLDSATDSSTTKNTAHVMNEIQKNLLPGDKMPFHFEQILKMAVDDYLVVDINETRQNQAESKSAEENTTTNAVRQRLDKDIIFEKELEDYKEYKRIREEAKKKQVEEAAAHAMSISPLSPREDTSPGDGSSTQIPKLKLNQVKVHSIAQQISTSQPSSASSSRRSDEDKSAKRAEDIMIDRYIDMKDKHAADVIHKNLPASNRLTLLETYNELYPIHESMRGLASHYQSPLDNLLAEEYKTNYDYQDKIVRVLVEPLHLHFTSFDQFGVSETQLFCSMVIYDGTIKVSETAWFSINPNNAVERAQAQKLLFQLNQISSNMYIIVKLARNFAGIHTETFNEFYLKPEKAVVKQPGNKSERTIGKTVSLLAQYKSFKSSPFACGVAKLSNALRKDTFIISNFFYMKHNLQDKQIMEAVLAEQIHVGDIVTVPSTTPFSSAGAMSKLAGKPISGHFQFGIREIIRSAKVLGRPHLKSDSNTVILHTDRDETIEAKELHKLQLTRRQKNLNIHNDLFISPVSFHNPRRDVKNIMVSVQLRTSDSVLEEQDFALPCFYDPFSNNAGNAQLKKELESSVPFKDKIPFYNDEFKCKLPLTLTKEHHLLFKFYNIYHKDSYVKKNGLKVLVGYAFMRVLQDEQFLYDGDFELPVYSALPPHNYLSTARDQDRYESGKPLFKFNLRSLSTCFVKNPQLNDFFKIINQCATKRQADGENAKPLFEYLTQTADLVGALNGLDKPLDLYLCFAPLVLDNLLLIIQQCKDEMVQRLAFKTLLIVAAKYHQEDRRVLQHFIKYQFKNAAVAEQLLQQYISFLAQADSLAERAEDTFLESLQKNIWFMFSLLLKAIILMRHAGGGKKYTFSTAFTDKIADLLDELRTISEKYLLSKQPLCLKITHQIAGFLRVLLYMMKKSAIMTMAARHIDLLRYSIYKTYRRRSTPTIKAVEDALCEIQLVFYSELFEYSKTSLSLFLPKSVKDTINSCRSETDVDETVFHLTHFLYTPYSDALIKCLMNSDRSIRCRAITLFRDLLLKHTVLFDENNLQNRQRAMQIHFEFVLKFLDIINHWRVKCDETQKKTKVLLAKLRKKLTQTENDLATSKESLKQLRKTNAAGEALKHVESKLNTEIKSKEMTQLQVKSMISKNESDIKVLAQNARDEKRELLTCVYHIICNMNEDVLRKWWCTEKFDPIRRIHFLMMLQLGLHSFEYLGKKELLDSFDQRFASRTPVSARSGSARNLKTSPKATSPLPARNTKSMSLFGSAEKRLSGIAMLFMHSGKNASGEVAEKTAPVIKANALPSPGGEKSPTATAKEFVAKLFHETLQRGITNTENLKEQFIKSEKYFSEVIGLTTLDFLMKFVADNRNDLKQRQQYIYNLAQQQTNANQMTFDPLTENILRCCLNLVHIDQSEGVMYPLLMFLRTIFSEFSLALFFCSNNAKNEYYESFAQEIMFMCNYKIKYLRTHAAALLYSLIRNSFEVNGSISKPRLITTLSLSKVLQEHQNLLNLAKDKKSAVMEAKYMQKAISFVSQLATLDPDAPGSKRQKMLHKKFGSLPGRQRSSSILNQQASPKSATSGLKTPEEEEPGHQRSVSNATAETFKKAFTMFRGLENKSLEQSSKNLDKMMHFVEDVQKLCNRLQSIVTNTMKVMNALAKEDCDTYKTEDLYYKISLGYDHIPELRFMWLYQLASFHKQNKQFIEAAQCYFRILSVIFDLWKKHNVSLLRFLPLQNFYGLTPYLVEKLKKSTYVNILKLSKQAPQTPPAVINIGDEELTTEDTFEDADNKLPQAQEFSEAGLIQVLHNCVQVLEQAEYYENASEIYKLLLAIYEKNHNYKKLSQCFEHLKQLNDLIDQSVTLNNRFYPQYFRLAVFGIPGEEYAGKQYIYKMPKLFKLFQMVKKVKEMFAPYGEVEIVSKPEKIDAENLPAGKVFVLLTAVKPYVEEQHFNASQTSSQQQNSLPILAGISPLERKTVFQRNTNINQFYFEVPHVPGSVKVGDGASAVTKTYKRKTILTTEQYFPTVKTRLHVASEKEVLLTPLEASIEVFIGRNQTFLETLEANPPDVQTLQMILQGAVCAGVNGGPNEIVSLFLGNKESYEKQHIQILNDKCHQFLRLCDKALKVCAGLIQPHQRLLHEALEKGFVETKEVFGKYLMPSTEENFADFTSRPNGAADNISDEDQMRHYNFRIPLPRHRRFASHQDDKDDEHEDEHLTEEHYL